MALVVDATGDPVIVVEIHGKLDNDDVAELLELGTHYVGRRRPYAIVYVPHTMSVPAFEDLKALFSWMKSNAAELDRWYRAMVVVTDSAVLRGALRAILALGRLRTPHRVTATLEEGLAWARAAMPEHDVRA